MLLWNPSHCRRWGNSSSDARLNISNNRWMPLSDWAQYRYVAHVDGISCSSRLEKLLALGSLVAKEDSGYRCVGAGRAGLVQLL